MNIPEASTILGKRENQSKIGLMRVKWPQLMSVKNYVIPETIQEYKELGGFLGTHITIRDQKCFFKEKVKNSLRDFANALYSIDEIKALVSYNCVYQNSKAIVQEAVEESLNEITKPFHEKLEQAINAIFKEVQTYQFYWPIVGLELKDIKELDFGEVKIFKFESDLVPAFQGSISEQSDNFFKEATKQFLEKNFIDKLVVKCSVLGEADLAEQVARQKAIMVFNYIRFMISYAIPEHVFNNSLKIDFEESTPANSGSNIRVNTDDNKVTLGHSSYHRAYQKFPITQQTVDTWKECYFFDMIKALLSSSNNCELAQAILTAIFWAGEAQEDWVHDFAYMKFWTAIETLIPSSKTSVTQDVINGTTVLIAYSGYRFANAKDFWDIRKGVSKLYEKRSQIVHAGLSHSVTPDEIKTICRYATWIVLSAIGLYSQGYRNFKQLKNEIDRLYSIHETTKEKEKVTSE